ncbi:MAG: PAS domain S-box protein [Hydrogenophaga sp.]|nr:PAS domain S-box protein [Hydrogenophaga sp.]
MKAWVEIRHAFARRTLLSQIRWLVLSVTVVGSVAIGTVSYQRSVEQTLDETRERSTALAMLAAHVAAPSLQIDDPASLDNTLREFAELPNIRSIQAVLPGGRVLLRIVKEGDGSVRTEFPAVETAEAPIQAHSLHDIHLHAYASLNTSRPRQPGVTDAAAYGEEGWIDLEVSYMASLERARTDWLVATLSTLALVSLALWFFSWFLRRALEPLTQLAAFSAQMASAPGGVLRMRWGSKEVRDLGRALNWSSQELATQIASTQHRLTRLRAILDTAADAVIGVRPDGTVDSTNPATERMFGRSAQDIHGQPLSSFLIGLDAAALQEAMNNGMLIHSTQSRIGRVEIMALRHGGTEFPVEVLLGEITNDPDIRYTCIVRDLSDSKLAEEYLTLYSRAVDCTINGIMISDARRFPQPLVYVNPAFSRLTGYAPHEVLGRDASLLAGALTDEEDQALLARTMQKGGEISLTLKNYRKDGSLFHNKLAIAPVRDPAGTITHYINVIEDVSGQIEVKQKLIERTARLNATFDLSPDGFAVFDGRGDLITSNPSFRAMVGDLPAWCSLQRFDEWFQNLCEDATHYRSITDAWNDRTTDLITLARPSYKVIEREIRRNLGGSGETILYFRDVTHQTEVDRMKSEFLATAAHELRTPLASILGFTELMLHRRYSEEKQRDLLQTVHKQGMLLSNLIQELLDLSRIEARQGKDFHIIPTPVAEIVREAIGSIANAELGRTVAVGTLPVLHVMADAEKIQQALTNLLSNAFKYSTGGAQVSVDVETETLEGQLCAAIHVRDKGMGMTQAQLARAFERFYRADTSGNIPGTGLGLNLVREIAEIHGGNVELQSQPGEGTVATLRLRIASAAEIVAGDAETTAEA